MNELPLSKFAPFTKNEACYQQEVSNKLKEINVKCSNCIYLGEKLPSLKLRGPNYPEDFQEALENLTLYKCNILDVFDSSVSNQGLCRFFTNLEEIEEIDEPKEEEKSEDTIEDNNQEMSLDLQKLDFTSNTIIESIKNLRAKIINE
jgi:hypothetical protein